ASKGTAAKVAFGLQGGARMSGVGWAVEDAMVINYMSSHDNHTLWDKLSLSAPDAATEEKLAMNRLGAAAVVLGRGTPFLLAGEEMLRSKGGDANSYRSSDAVNNLDWDALTPESNAWAMSRFYRQLLTLRRENNFLRDAEVTCEVLSSGAIVARYAISGSEVAAALFNGTDGAVTLEGFGGWTVLLRGDGSSGGTAGGSVTVQPTDFLLLKK
ncbi:MAG: DUF3459 domain-containing protein, partial [Oscillospiraceae bacterium]|nr:DUF3459 domain-containing protein [Oscillospiraceae bacterium]